MRRSSQGGWRLLLSVAAVAAALVAPARADPPPPVLSLEEAVCFALEHNPQLAVVRQQRGLAAAGVVIARTYPYNPVLQSIVLGVNGPADSGITNHVFNEHVLSLQLEL